MSYYEIYSMLGDKQKIEFMNTMLDIQFLKQNVNNISFKDKTLTLLWKAVEHSVKKQIEGYCNSKKVQYCELFDAYGDASVVAYEASPIQEKGEVKGQEEEQGEVKGLNASLRFATLSLKSSKDNQTHKPRQVVKELEAKYSDELDDEYLLEMVIRFIEYRDDIYSSTKDKKYGLKTMRSVVGFINEMAEVIDKDKAFQIMEESEWATFKREWVKGNI